MGAEFRPAGRNVLIKMVKVEDETEGGIVVATQEQLKKEQAGQFIGEIISFGPLVYTGIDGIEGRNPIERAKEWGVSVGDVVQFERYNGSPVYQDEDHAYVIDTQLKGAKI